MKRKMYVLFACLLIFTAKSASSEIQVNSSTEVSFEESTGKDERDSAEHKRTRVIGLRRFLLCVDGLKVFQTIGPSASGAWGSAGYNLNPSVSTIQLYEERDGKVVPARCP